MMIKRTRQMKANVLKHSVKILARRVKFLAKNHLRKSKSFIRKKTKIIREKFTMHILHTSDSIELEASVKIGQGRWGLRVGLANAN